MLTALPLESNAVTMMLFVEKNKSELDVQTFGFEDYFMIGDAASESPTAFTIPTILLYGHPNALGDEMQTPTKSKKVSESKDAEIEHKVKVLAPPPSTSEAAQPRKPSAALSLLKNSKNVKHAVNHGHLEIVKASAMEDGKWYRVSADTMRALGYTKETDELFVTTTPVFQSFFKFIEVHGKGANIVTWITDIRSEDSGETDSLMEMLFSDDSSSDFDLHLLQYSILKECIVTKLPAGVKAEAACVHLNASSRILKLILGKIDSSIPSLKTASTEKKRGIFYLKSDEAMKKINETDAPALIVWLCLAISLFGISSTSKGPIDEAVTSQWNKFFSLLPTVEAENNSE